MTDLKAKAMEQVKKSVEEVLEKVRVGKIDLRDMGVALQLGFDQDLPRQILMAAIALRSTPPAEDLK
jgi:hypothetical protein